MTLLGPVFGDELGKRFLVFYCENQNWYSRVELYATIERFGIQETNLFELVGETPRRILAVVAGDNEMWCLDLSPGIRFVSGGWFAPCGYIDKQQQTERRNNASTPAG